MPELPEVETIRRQLAPHLEGRRIVQARIDDWRFTRPDPPELVAVALAGAEVARLGRHGKYLDWELADGRHLLVHLRMTGALLLAPAAEPPHTRAEFTLDGGVRLVYVDPRRFGTGTLLDSTAARDGYLRARLGPEPLTPAFTVEHLRAAARGRRTPVKAFVLDQRRIAGVGNIYADEALHRACIHPLRVTGALSRADLVRLRDAIEVALRDGIDAKGATIDDFRHLDGAYGSFQDRFRVYSRAGEPCPECGAAIRKLVVAGRGTYVCESCQPPPRARGTRTAGAAAGARAARAVQGSHRGG